MWCVSCWWFVFVFAFCSRGFAGREKEEGTRKKKQETRKKKEERRKKKQETRKKKEETRKEKQERRNKREGTREKKQERWKEERRAKEGRKEGREGEREEERKNERMKEGRNRKEDSSNEEERREKISNDSNLSDVCTIRNHQENGKTEQPTAARRKRKNRTATVTERTNCLIQISAKTKIIAAKMVEKFSEQSNSRRNCGKFPAIG